jgi:NADPH2:quinone reductase
LLTPFLERAGVEIKTALQKRIVEEMTTTFASTYQQELSLEGALQASAVATYSKQATGEKFLINPSL